MLLALSRPSRSADLSKLDISRCVYKPDSVCFYPTSLAKQSRSTSQISSFFFPSLPLEDNLCPVSTLKEYEKRTKSLQGDEILLSPIRRCPLVLWLDGSSPCWKLQVLIHQPSVRTQSGELHHLQLHQQVFLPQICLKQRVRAQSPPSRGFTTDLLTILHSVEQCSINAVNKLQTTPFICETEPSEL